MNKKTRLVVLSGPSGSGKSTVINQILKRRSAITLSISYTTRPPRAYEVDGVHYHFISHENFLRGIEEGRFVEWEEVHGEYYGTSRESLERKLDKGQHVMLDIDVNGGERIKRAYPDTLLIFLYPPSVEELRRRLKLRGADDDETIERRLQRYPFEKSKGDRYPYRLVNDDLEKTVQKVLDIIDDNIVKENKADDNGEDQEQD